ncbi:MAG: tetratricopeptide repeat protein [Solirubrobacterales bacterium]|nr:tetratricopeptide repeat protein [Solirubrobacterales bacterium]
MLVDAQIELGRYEAAGRSLQQMIDLRPNLASYARVSYFRELHGDLAGALEAMSLAVSAGGQAPENVAYVQTLLGDLQATRGRHGAARRAYEIALAVQPGYVPARASLAGLDAATGRMARAMASYRQIVAQRPLPQYVIALGETQMAAGRPTAARETFALVDAERRLLAANGVNTDVEIALFEADHGDRRRAVTLARRAWHAAPSVRSADAVGWALTRAGDPRQGLAWARRALRLGWRDPLVLTRAGLSARAAGQRVIARRYLRRALRANPRFSPTWAPRARRALRQL